MISSRMNSFKSANKGRQVVQVNVSQTSLSTYNLSTLSKRDKICCAFRNCIFRSIWEVRK